MIFEITRKKLFFFGTFIVIMLAIPLTVFLSQRQQNPNSNASAVVPDSTVIVTINGENITKGDIREVAAEQYDMSAIDIPVLQDALDVVEERKILDLEASAKSISVDSSEVQTRMDEEGLSQTQAYYEVLRNQVTLIEVKSRLVLSVGFWSPAVADRTNLSAEDKQTAKNVARDAGLAFPGINSKMTSGQDVMTIAEDVAAQYSTLADFVAVNGYKISGLPADEKKADSEPQIVESGDANMDSTVLSTVFAMPVNSVKTISNTPANSAGSVFKVLQKGNDSGTKTYDTWLASRKTAIVIVKSAL